MTKTETTIINPTGLHARPASDFVHTAKEYSSKITISESGSDEIANAKSIIQVLSLALKQGTKVELIAEGDDEQAAVDALAALIDTGFGE